MLHDDVTLMEMHLRQDWHFRYIPSSIWSASSAPGLSRAAVALVINKAVLSVSMQVL